MPVVTALRATRSGGVALHLDGEYAFTVSESLVARWRLFKDRELDDDAVDALRAAASSERVMADAYRLLGHRARSRRELQARLLEKGHDDAVVRGALDRLADDGLLDDAAFARSYVADKRGLSGWGTERIRRGLAALGVADDIAAAEIGAASPDHAPAELDRALDQLRRRGEPVAPFDVARRRAYHALLRRGFSGSVAYTAVQRWSGAAPPGEN